METIKELRKICQVQISEKSKLRKKGGSLLGYEKHRILSIYITWILLKLFGKKMKPNCFTLLNILFGIILLVLIALTQNQYFVILFLLLLYFSFLLDKVDGEVARYQKKISAKGVYLDDIYHLFVQNGLILAIGINRFLVEGKAVFLFLGVIGYILFLLIRYIRKERYIIYAHKYRYFKSQNNNLLMTKKLGETEKIFSTLLNSLPFKLTAIISRYDIFLFLVIIFSIFCFRLTDVWFWLLFIWVALSIIYFLRFLFLNYIFIGRDIQLIEKNKI